MGIFRALILGLFIVSPLAAVHAQSAAGAAMDSYRRGRDLEARGRLDEANVYYNEAIRVCQDEVSRSSANRDTYAVITWALNRQRKYADVITWGERGLRIYADEYRVIETMGEAYFYLDDYSRSLAFMQRYTNAQPQGERASVAYFFIGEIFRLTNKNRRADIAYTTAVKQEPGVPLWWYRLGMVRETIGDLPQAAEAYQRALLLNPNYAEAEAALARVQKKPAPTAAQAPTPQ